MIEEFNNEVDALLDEFKDEQSQLLAEIIFFKLFVKFEAMISKAFYAYCIGVISPTGYTPNRKLNFDDEIHLKAVIKKNNNDFLDNIDTVARLSKHIFNQDPFECITSSTTYSGHISKMQAIRNYVAHESPASKRKYEDTCLSNNSFIPPGEFLLKINRRVSKTHFTIFIDAMKEIISLIENPINS